MPNNNPGGENGYAPNGVESAYGAVKRMEESKKIAPVAQPGVAAPKRAQRNAARGQQPQPLHPPAEPTLAAAPPPAAAVWAMVAQIPGITPLAAEYAQDA